MHLTKAAEEDQVNLLVFVKSIDSIISISDEMHEIHRDIDAKVFIDKFVSKIFNILCFKQFFNVIRFIL